MTIISQVTSITREQIYTKFNELPKEYKIALGVFALLSACLTLKLAHWVWTRGPAEQPKPIEEIKLLTEEQIEKLPVIPDNVVGKIDIDPTSRALIIEDATCRFKAFFASGKSVPICKGWDSLNNPFYVYSFENVDTKAVVSLILTSVQVEGKSQSFFATTCDFKVGKDVTLFLQELIKGENAQYKLIEAAPEDEKKVTIDKGLFSFEIQKAFQGSPKLLLKPVFYVSEAKRTDIVDQPHKYDAINAQCVNHTAPETSINLGLDAWGEPFIEVYYKDKVSNHHEISYIYSVDDVWYIDNDRITDATSDSLEKLIKGTHPAWILAE